MMQKLTVNICLLVLLVASFLGAATACRSTAVRQQAVALEERTQRQPDTTANNVNKAIGFTSRRSLEEHYAKHRREFGDITQPEYLLRAQILRDAPVTGDVLEVVRKDGVSTRFDRRSQAFLAFNQDQTIRTFFIPNDGERYFRRQLSRSK